MSLYGLLRRTNSGGCEASFGGRRRFDGPAAPRPAFSPTPADEFENGRPASRPFARLSSLVDTLAHSPSTPRSAAPSPTPSLAAVSPAGNVPNGSAAPLAKTCEES